MLRFEPPTFRGEFLAAVRVLKKESDVTLYDWEGIDAADFDFDSAIDDVISPDSKVTLMVPEIQSPVAFLACDFVELGNELPSSKLVHNAEYLAPSRALFHLAPSTTDAHVFVGHLNYSGVTAKWFPQQAGEDVHLCLVNGFTAFAVRVCIDGEYAEFHPPFMDGSVFLEVRHPEGQDEGWRRWVPAYLFELEHQTGIGFIPMERPTLAEVPEEEDKSTKYLEALRTKVRLRPLLDGPGIPSVLDLYTRAIHREGDPEQHLVGLVKVLEFIAATVVDMERYQQIRRRLLSQRALAPDAAYIRELAELFDTMRSFRKDSEALRLTVETCCDPVELAHHAPPRLKGLAAVSDTSSPQDRKKALDALSASLSATRNMFSHAKANYTPTGDECPETELPQLIACARLAAQQAIRWFAASDEKLRVYT